MAQSEHIKLGYLRDPENHEMYFPYTHYLGVIGLDTHVNSLIGQALPVMPTKLSDLTNDIISYTNHTLTLEGTNISIPYYSNKTFHFGSNSFGFTEYISGYLAAAANGTTNITADTPNPYLRTLQKLAGESAATDVLTTQFKGVVDTNNFGIRVIGKADKTINVSLTGVDDLAAIEALTGTSGYLKKTAANTWTLDQYGGSTVDSVDNSGTSMTSSSSATAGLKTTTSNGTSYQKLSFAAITNDTATGNNAVTIILNGNFS